MTQELKVEPLSTGRLNDHAEPIYRVRARNMATDSENKIHDDEVASRYGFRGGLVPGVTIYAYMTESIVSHFPEWLENGSMDVRFQKPFYDGEIVCVRAEVDASEMPVKMTVKAEREDGEVCAVGSAIVNDNSIILAEPLSDNYPAGELPAAEGRREATLENFKPDTLLGALELKLDLRELEESYLKTIDERLSLYYGDDAVLHPGYLLGLANEIFVRNFKVSPWIHAGSKLKNCSVAKDGETLSVRGRVRETFARKGHEFVVLDLLALADGSRVVQQVQHTAIYKLR